MDDNNELYKYESIARYDQSAHHYTLMLWFVDLFPWSTFTCKDYKIYFSVKEKDNLLQ